jgi:hypothetical protein
LVWLISDEIGDIGGIAELDAVEDGVIAYLVGEGALGKL